MNGQNAHYRRTKSKQGGKLAAQAGTHTWPHFVCARRGAG
jgi:hypothetical protein